MSMYSVCVSCQINGKFKLCNKEMSSLPEPGYGPANRAVYGKDMSLDSRFVQALVTLGLDVVL